ncbi:MAG: hypothetical protein ACO398_01140 [Kiritimatiellia bacterium]|jgi:hypothetical protein
MTANMLRPFAGALAGALAGYLIYLYIGCRTGTCPITANPYTSVVVYALMGALLFGGR